MILLFSKNPNQLILIKIINLEYWISILQSFQKLFYKYKISTNTMNGIKQKFKSELKISKKYEIIIQKVF